MAHFHLTDFGDLEFESFGEAAEDAIFETAYPKLYQELVFAPRNRETGFLTQEGKAKVETAVAGERRRVIPKRVQNSRTLLGREVKKRSNMPSRPLARMLRRIAKERLEEFKGEGNPQ
jgi:hypothetical protein